MKNAIAKLKKFLRIKNDLPMLNGRQITEKIKNLSPDKQTEAKRLVAKLYGVAA